MNEHVVGRADGKERRQWSLRRKARIGLTLGEARVGRATEGQAAGMTQNSRLRRMHSQQGRRGGKARGGQLDMSCTCEAQARLVMPDCANPCGAKRGGRGATTRWLCLLRKSQGYGGTVNGVLLGVVAF
jgi:hypothetical protein